MTSFEKNISGLLELDYTSLFFRFLRNWYLLAIGLGIAIGVQWYFLKFVTPIYQVKGTVLITDNNRNSLTQEAIVSPLNRRSMGGASTEAEIQILKSRSTLKKVVDSLRLNVTTHIKGPFVTKEIYDNPPVELQSIAPVGSGYGHQLEITQLDSTSFSLIHQNLIEDQEIADTSYHAFGIPFSYRGVVYTVSYNYATNFPIIIKIKDPEKVAQSYSKRIDIISMLNDTRGWAQSSKKIFELSLNTPVPKKAIAIINTLVSVHDDSKIKEKRETANKTLTFIDERLKYLQKELFQVEKSVENIKQRQEIPLDISKNASRLLDQLTTADETLTELNFKEKFLLSIQKDLLSDSKQPEFIALNDELGGPALASVVMQYNNLITERSQLLITVNPKSLLIKNIDDQLVALKTKVIENIKLYIASIQDRKAGLKEKVNPIVAQISEIPKNERELLEVMRQQKIKESLFVYLLQKREETAITVAAQVSDTRILDAPIRSNKPMNPQKSRLFLLASLIGLGIPAAFLVLRELLDTKIYSKKDIQNITAIPFLGEIGVSKTKDQIVVQVGKRTSIAEMFRMLRTNLNFLLPTNGNPCRTILTTSSVSGEGKTFISINLAASIAISGKKTLLVGMDMRKPRLAEYLGKNHQSKGVSTFLSGGVEHVQEIIQAVPDFENLFFISSGPIPPNPSELIIEANTEKFFAALKQEFDYILIDTPPVGLVTDAFLIGKHAKVSLLVTKRKVTSKQQVNYFEEIYNQKKLPNVALILNEVKRSKRYGYGEGYYQEEKKKWFHIK